MPDDHAPRISAVRTELGPAYVREGYESIPWDRLYRRGEDPAGRPIYTTAPVTQAHRRVPRGAAKFSADVFPAELDASASDVLTTHFRLASRVERVSKHLCLPRYFAAARLPDDESWYALFSEYERRDSYRHLVDQYAVDRDPESVAGFIGTLFSELHENGIYHRRGFDVDHLLLRTAEDQDDTGLERWLMLSHNWGVIERRVEEISEEELTSLFVGFLVGDATSPEAITDDEMEATKFMMGSYRGSHSSHRRSTIVETSRVAALQRISKWTGREIDPDPDM